MPPYMWAVCSTAFGTCHIWFGIEAELAEQLKLGKHVAIQIDVKETRKDVRIVLDEVEVFAVMLRYLYASASTNLVSSENKFR